MSRQEHLPALDGVRGLAILLVVLLHTSVPPVPVPLAPTAFDMGYARVGAFGWAGVDLFFVLSGYLITGILVRARGRPGYCRDFYARRALRILPLYYAIALLRIFVWPGDGFTVPEAASYLGFWSNWYQAWSPGLALTNADRVLSVTWSLAIEEQFYLVWPLVVALLPPRALRLCCAAIAVAAPGLRHALLTHGTDWTVAYLVTPCRIDGLALGALVALLPELGPRTWRLLLAVASLGLGLAIWQQAGSTAAFGLWMQTLGYSCNAAIGAAVIGLVVRGGGTARLFEFAFLRALGRHSYAIYLLHYTLLHALVPLCFGAGAWLPLDALIVRCGAYWPGCVLWLSVVLAVSHAAALCTWHLLEKHMLRLKRFFPGAGA